MTETGHTFCSDIAREHNVPLMASATRGGLWFLLEYSGSYEGKAFEQSEIPEQVKDYLQGVKIPGLKTRILLIRQEDSRQRDGLHFFIGVTDPQNPRLFEYRLQSYTGILELNLAELAAQGFEDSEHLRREPLFLVCTNGRRDACCARYGPEIYQ
ncbi:MAG TPA: hypothetical protein DCY42_01890, partial [Chloroflexi bacterium]|nr:hypothetical protein [Chloroflexota bacterium]